MEIENLSEEENTPKHTRNDFTLKRTLKEMIVLDLGKNTISMYEILNYLKYHQLKPFTLTFKDLQNQTFILKCHHISKNEFNFEIGETKGEEIFTNPIIYFGQDNKRWEFISMEQIHYFLDLFNLPMIKCKLENKNYSPTLFNIVTHFKHEDKVIDIFTYEIYDKDSFNNFFKNCPDIFLNKTFENPKHFDKNFDYYFNYNKLIKLDGKFHIYDDIENTRSYISKDFLDLRKPSPYYYYGAEGKGKSITIIGSLKYRNNFNKFGSFYINCKSLKYHLLKKNNLIVRQILINEILY